LTAYGFSIQSNFQDVSALQKEKAAFWGGFKAELSTANFGFLWLKNR